MRTRFIAKAFFTIVVGGGIILWIGPEKFATSFNKIEPSLFALALFLLPAIILVGSYKWFAIIRHEARGTSFRGSIGSFLGGAALGLLTPGRVGEFGRIAFIKEGRKSVLGGIALIDKMIDLEVTLALGAIGAPFFFGITGVIVVLAGVALGALFIFYPALFSMLINPKAFGGRFAEKIANVKKGMEEIPKRALMACMGFRLLASAIDIVQFYLLLLSFHEIKLMEVIVVYPIIILSNLLPLTIGGLGIRESVSMIVLSRFGIAPETAASASFLLFVINSLLPALLGVVFIFKSRAGKVLSVKTA